MNTQPISIGSKYDIESKGHFEQKDRLLVGILKAGKTNSMLLRVETTVTTASLNQSKVVVSQQGVVKLCLMTPKDDKTPSLCISC